MDLENIQDQLNILFSKSENRIVFWFDDKGDYEDEVSQLQLGSVKLHILDGTNWLYSKWLLNESDKDGKYEERKFEERKFEERKFEERKFEERKFEERKFLVYGPFPKPSDAQNPLADMCYYSVQYYTDRISQMLQEMGIDNRFKEHFAQYENFWKDKNRIEKFKELDIDHYNVETIDIGLIAAVTDVKKPNFEEIVKQLLFNDSEKYIKAIEYSGLTTVFWSLCKKYFGYETDKPNIDDLAASKMVTYASISLKDTLPASFKGYVLKRKNDVMVFVRNAMDNVNCQEAYDSLSLKVDKELRFTARIKSEFDKDSRHLSNIFACDAFIGLDNILIDWIAQQLDSEILDSRIDGCNIAQIADQRIAKAYHFGMAFVNEYTALKYAYMMMKSVSLMEFTGDIKTLVEKYRSETYLVDSYYRWFYYAYDKIEDNERFENIRERVLYIFITTRWMPEVIRRQAKTRCLMPAVRL